jgi:hypothetical protein
MGTRNTFHAFSLEVGVTSLLLFLGVDGGK